MIFIALAIAFAIQLFVWAGHLFYVVQKMNENPDDLRIKEWEKEANQLLCLTMIFFLGTVLCIMFGGLTA